ncbi:MAG TPA: type III secretion system cytoplasmic ring protein SctQ [Polyangiales bacterium]|nr:type III secretion system cytoplasmic ring protein SctQ [Polyangiales bacterium]
MLASPGMQGRPYPFEQLARVSRAEAVRLRILARSLPDASDPALAREAAALLGAPLGIRPLAPELLASAALHASLPDPLCAIALELEGHAQPAPLWLELSLETAAALVDRVLGGDGRPAPLLGRGLDELSAGVLGYLAARLCAASATALRVRAVESSRDASLPIATGAGVLVWPLALSLAGQRLGVARLLVPETSAALLPRAGVQRPFALPAALADLKLTLCAHAGRVSLRREELDALAPGDAVVPDRCRLVRVREGLYGGELELHALGCRAGFSCRLDGAGIEIEHATYCGDGTMTDTKALSTPSSSTSELAADAPIELCLELARFNLPLRELSALRPGEVLSAGSAIGALVTLTASGKPIARGELVDVQGEVGMRVLELVR